MEDSKIIQLYFDRDESAISHTQEKYGAYCTSIANNILGCEEDAEECVNDTYIKAWNTIPPHRPGVLSTFLGKITRNLSFNRYKQNTAQKGAEAIYRQYLMNLRSVSNQRLTMLKAKRITKNL